MKPLTREQIREIDRQAIEDYGIAGVVLMENAGRNAAHLIIEHLDRPDQPPVCIVCGRGNNGGDGFVIARHLVNQQYPVQIVLLAAPNRLSPDAKANYDVVEKMSIPILTYEHDLAADLIAESQVVVDAILGTGFSGEVRFPFDEAIRLVNSADHALRVAIDVPSGLDCNSGQPASTTVRAKLTITFVASKVGFDQPRAKDYTGQVVVVDIGTPRTLLDSI